ncbi:aspartate carbamoyltransferase [Candidatus Micrarchaeota archaeon]|nr:aspartate carbamoyltransferase [Candidatus Micrarchaeota archaeon]
MDLISFRDLSKEDVEDYFARAEEMDRQLEAGNVEKLDGIVATMFFEPSTRTKLSFQSAAERLGLQIVDFVGSSSSLKKGESFEDTIRTVDGYADIIVIRHPLEGSARVASEFAEAPIANGGDGGNQHPSQTLLDLYTLKKMKGDIGALNVHLVGDLKHARTMRSLLYGLGMFGAKVKLVAPSGLEMARDAIADVKRKFEMEVEETETIDFKDADVVYVCRIQEERFEDKYEAMSVKKKFTIKPEYLQGVKEDMIILHPLPKIDEIPPEVDKSKYAKYFEQAKNGIPMRMGIMKKMLGSARQKKG